MAADPLFERLCRALADRYEVVRELGHGGMGAVYLATDLRLGRRLVAVKVLPPRTYEYLGGERFAREVQLAAQLSHPHIVPVFEAGEADGLLFYVMAYVEGESLETRLAREGPLPLDDALDIISQVAGALEHAHARGFLHRDVKPANILLTTDQAMVTDFGIGRAIAGAEGDSLTATGVAVGTPGYMSPEQASGDKRLDARSDVYGLAATLYEMLAGEPPFTGPSAQAIIARVVADPPRSIRTIRPELPLSTERALAAGLAKMPADRPASARAFVDLLRRSRTGTAARRPRRLLVVGGLGLAALGLGVWLATQRWTLEGMRPETAAGMAVVPAGRYTMGAAGTLLVASLDSFYIDSSEATVGAYAAFVAATGTPVPWVRRPPDAWPVTGVLWTEAVAYCRWRDPHGRLPTEAEWEAAARGPAAWRYPWGSDWAVDRANAAGATDTLAPVGAFPLGRSWVGAVDFIGNAWEWTATAAPGRRGETWHVIKGGAFNTPRVRAHAAYRAALPDERGAVFNTGFRCARPRRID